MRNVQNEQIKTKTKLENDKYKLFPVEFENHENIVFHGTKEEYSNSIENNGCQFTTELKSVFFSRTSDLALGYACKKRTGLDRGTVLAVRFNDMNAKGIDNGESSCIYLRDLEIQPEILCICYIPNNYKHI